MWGALNLWPTTRGRASWLGLFLREESKVLSIPSIWMCNTDTDTLNCSILMYILSIELHEFQWLGSSCRRKYFTHCSQQYKVSAWCCYAIDCIRTGKQTTDPARVDRSSHCTGWIYTITIFTTTDREHKDMKCDWNDQKFFVQHHARMLKSHVFFTLGLVSTEVK